MLNNAGKAVGASFSTCTYGNFFEFGWNVSDGGGWPESTCESPGSCLEQNRCNANKILWHSSTNLSDAIIREYQDDKGHKGMLMPSGCLGQPCAMMDPATESYSNHLLSMARTALEKTPDGNAGLCVDRQDMVGTINPHADDGVTLYQYQGAPAEPVVGRSTFHSFNTLMQKLGPMLDDASKGIMINAHSSRVRTQISSLV